MDVFLKQYEEKGIDIMGYVLTETVILFQDVKLHTEGSAKALHTLFK